jgi:hemerythrin superfamily protein
MARRPDALQMLVDDHNTVEDLFKRFEEAGDRAHKTKAGLVERIVKELSIHAAIEEQVLYPISRALDEEIEADVLEALEEHNVAKWLLSELDGMDPEEERFNAKVTVLMENVRHHVEEEESELFPLIQEHADSETLKMMSEAMTEARKTAPTRPHPRAADTPPGNVANLVVGIVDRFRDSARDRRRKLSREMSRSGA